MSLTTWITFFIASCVISLSPGSGAVLSMSHGLTYGVRKTTGTILGLISGVVFVLLVVGAGVGSLLLASEMAFNLVKIVGAIYLIWLGLSQWRAKVEPDSAAAGPLDSRAAAPTLRKRFLLGFLTNATNPKGIVYMVAVIPQFIAHQAPLLPQLVLMAATVSVIDFSIMHGYALAASSMQRYFRNARAVKRQNQLFGGMLMAFGALLFFVRRDPAP